MAKSIAQHIEEQQPSHPAEVEPGTILVVDSHPYIYLPSGKRPYFNNNNDTIIIM